MKNLRIVFVAVSFLASAWLSIGLSSCSSKMDVKQQKYAKLKDSRVFENEMPDVWKAIEEVFRNYHVTDRDPNKVDGLELRKLKKRTLETDWSSTQSRDKYIEYKVNGFPRKQYLWTRMKFKIIAEAVLGGIQVTVKDVEEIQRLNQDGSDAGYETADAVDSSRTSEILDKIQAQILAAPPIAQPQ